MLLLLLLYKVRAHRGIAGNEAADAIAKQAATPGCHTVPFTSAPSLPSLHFWEAKHLEIRVHTWGASLLDSAVP